MYLQALLLEYTGSKTQLKNRQGKKRDLRSMKLSTNKSQINVFSAGLLVYEIANKISDFDTQISITSKWPSCYFKIYLKF